MHVCMHACMGIYVMMFFLQIKDEHNFQSLTGFDGVGAEMADWSSLYHKDYCIWDTVGPGMGCTQRCCLLCSSTVGTYWKVSFTLSSS